MHLTVAAAFAGLICSACAGATPLPETAATTTRRPVSTYSIVARDPATGELGVAVQSHWFSVGSVVPWAQAGVGAVATQSFADPAYGSLGLDLMRVGRTAPEALASVLAGDPGREVRQVAMIDADGRIAAHTGSKCIAAAGHIVDAGLQFSVQANLMANDTVWGAMAEAFRRHKGDLADRMIAALEAAERAGGDVRGRQSAALLVVSAKPTGKPWVDRRFDIRIEDHSTPLKELKRLVRLQRAYLHMNAADLAMEKKDFAGAAREYAAAEQLAPEIVEIPFWHAVTLVGSGRLSEALPIFREVFAKEPVWLELLPRLVEVELMPDDPKIRAAIAKQGPDAAE